MDFPWEIFPALLSVAVLLALIMLSPVIIGSLIGQIAQFFRNLFGGKDDDE